MPDVLEPGKLDVFLIFSGDNFFPYRLHFVIDRENLNDPDRTRVQLLSAQKV